MNDTQLWYLMVVGLLANKNVYDIGEEDVRQAGVVVDLIAAEGIRLSTERKPKEDEDVVT